MRKIFLSDLMGSVAGAMAYVSASVAVALVRRTHQNASRLLH